jgi:RNA polymerase sigma-70 factor (ECF subfamily)
MHTAPSLGAAACARFLTSPPAQFARELPSDGATLSLVAGARSDLDLIERCRAGDNDAVGLLFDRHRAEVSRLVFRMLGPSAELEDLVQEVFLQVMRSLAAFQGNAQFSTWLYRVTVNVVLMHRRTQSRRPRLVQEELAPPPSDPEPSPEDQVGRRLRIAGFYRALDQLSEKKRVVFVLHELEGMAPARIATIVRAPVLTVRTRLFYARRELAERLMSNPELASVLGHPGSERDLAQSPLDVVSEAVPSRLRKGSA